MRSDGWRRIERIMISFYTCGFWRNVLATWSQERKKNEDLETLFVVGLKIVGPNDTRETS
jgi:hypothetical protein